METETVAVLGSLVMETAALAPARCAAMYARKAETSLGNRYIDNQYKFKCEDTFHRRR
jgi:hypothetical protein